MNFGGTAHTAMLLGTMPGQQGGKCTQMLARIKAGGGRRGCPDHLFGAGYRIPGGCLFKERGGRKEEGAAAQDLQGHPRYGQIGLLVRRRSWKIKCQSIKTRIR